MNNINMSESNYTITFNDDVVQTVHIDLDSDWGGEFLVDGNSFTIDEVRHAVRLAYLDE